MTLYFYPSFILGSTSAMAGPEEKGPLGRLHVNKKHVLLESWNEFLSESSLHGVKYFIGTRFIVKAFWVRNSY